MLCVVVVSLVFFSFRDDSNPIFESPIRLEAGLTDLALMFSVYHVNAGAEISPDDQIGAATTTMNQLIQATEAKPIKLQLLKDDVDLEGAEITAFVKKI